MYFQNCTNKEQATQLYKELAKIHHPAKGGLAAVWLKITQEFTGLTFDAPQPQEQPEQTEATQPDQPNQDEPNDDEELNKAIELVKTLDGVKAELNGKWLWVTGNTLTHWQTLKSNGFYFSFKKKAAYFRTEKNKVWKRTGRQLEMEEIKNKYGSTELF